MCRPPHAVGGLRSAAGQREWLPEGVLRARGDGFRTRLLSYSTPACRPPHAVGGLCGASAGGFQKVFFGREEVAIPVQGSVADAARAYPRADVFINFASMVRRAVSRHTLNPTPLVPLVPRADVFIKFCQHGAPRCQSPHPKPYTTHTVSTRAPTSSSTLPAWCAALSAATLVWPTKTLHHNLPILHTARAPPGTAGAVLELPASGRVA